MTTASEHIAAFADQLTAAGHLTGERWRDAVHDVPRHLFIPDVALACPNDGSPPYVIDHRADPDLWRTAVYSDTAVVIQIDDGATDVTTATATTPAPLPRPAFSSTSSPCSTPTPATTCWRSAPEPGGPPPFCPHNSATTT